MEVDGAKVSVDVSADMMMPLRVKYNEPDNVVVPIMAYKIRHLPLGPKAVALLKLLHSYPKLAAAVVIHERNRMNV
eukprot:8805144-Pyramimonas_sp.AAC.1